MEASYYTIEKTKNRTSRATLKNDKILIRLARGLSMREEKNHIDALLRRMAKVRTKLINMPLIDPFRSLLKGDMSLTVDFTQNHSLSFAVESGPHTLGHRTDEGWRIEKSNRISEHSFHRFLWKLTSMAESERMENLVREVNARTLNLPVKNFGMRLTKSRWGSCSHDGNINLSTALLFVPADLCEYVIVHELAHILHPNHSHRFWSTVASVMPDYKERLKKLRQYRLPQVRA